MNILIPLYDGRSVVMPYRYLIGQTAGEIIDAWPFSVLYSPTPLYLVLREVVHVKVEAKRRTALLKRREWQQAEAAL
ncbi:MAG TPA: hypothetical protein VKT32_14545, partial [Chthonomonadaceae bacterium]|nr:hypothetical protein [Chthonomonadaceae bacterium]